MIELSNTTTQTIEPGEIATFDTTLLHTGCGECHRRNTGVVNLNARGNCRQKPIYEVFFNGNVGGAAGTQANLVVGIGVSNLPETTMTATITAATDVYNVSAHTFVSDCCDNFDSLSIRNVGTAAVTLAANPSFAIRRIS